MSRKVITLGYFVNSEDSTLQFFKKRINEFVEDGALSELGIAYFPIEKGYLPRNS